MELALFLTLPATVALIVCGVPIVAALFQHGKFTADDTLLHRAGARRLLDRAARATSWSRC